MTCHSQIWNDSPILAPVRASYQSGIPIAWTRVHNLPDYVFGASSVDCAGKPRYSFTYWANPFPGSTACTTAHDFNPRDMAGDGVFDPNWTRSFRSDHEGGVQFTLADGSVHFFSENIDAELLDALATRSGGEIVGEF